MYTIIDSFQRRGIYDVKVIENTFSPLFAGKDISINVTLKEFYEIVGIDLHIYATEIHSYNLVDFSHKTHPDWRLVDAIYCSCCLPVAFSPLLRDGCCYCDGGVISNYPLRQCLEGGADLGEVLGVKMSIDRTNQARVHSESSIFDYIIVIFNKIMEKRLLAADLIENHIAYELKIESPQISIYNAYSIISSQEEMARLIDYGVEEAIRQLASS
jgi:predicted acylesterase/phospholipase RssA